MGLEATGAGWAPTFPLPGYKLRLQSTAMPRTVPKGCVYLRGRRWWYKLHGRCYACKPRDSRLATTEKSVAVVIARRIYERVTSQRAPLQPLIELFERAESLAGCKAHVEHKLRTVRDFVASLRIESPYDITPTAIQDYMAQRRATGRSSYCSFHLRARGVRRILECLSKCLWYVAI